MTLTQPEATTSVPYTSTATTERTVSIIGTAETPAPGLISDKKRNSAKISEKLKISCSKSSIYLLHANAYMYSQACLCHIWSLEVTLGHLLSVFKGHVRPFFLLVMRFLWNMLDVLRLESFGVYQVIWAKPILGFITKSVKVRVEKLWRDRCWWRRNGCWRCHQHIWSQNDFFIRISLLNILK